jgi:hypothetical protein
VRLSFFVDLPNLIRKRILSIKEKESILLLHIRLFRELSRNDFQSVMISEHCHKMVMNQTIFATASYTSQTAAKKKFRTQ